MSAHPPLDRLLEEPTSDEIRAHLAGCAACRAQARWIAAATRVDPSSLPALDEARAAMAEARSRGSRDLSVSLGGPPVDAWGDEPALGPGDEIDRYVVEARVAAGGMGTVYRVRHRQLGSAHALKVLQRASPAERARLMREGRAQGALRHPCVVPVTDVVDVSGAPGLILEYVDGPTLARFLSEHGRPSSADAERIGEDLLRGVAAAHRAGIVHRDLKPANVLLTRGDDGWSAKVTDFGLARPHAGEQGADLTRSGAPLGTPAYMAPEQVHDASRADARSDVFAAGAVLYELVTGQRAFAGADLVDTYDRVRAGRRRPVLELAPDAPPRLVAAIDAALSVDPEARPANGEALLSLWRGAPPARPPASRARRVIPVLAGAASLLGGLALATWWAQRPDAPVAPDPRWAPTADRRVTALPDELQIYAMALSADGATLAFSDSRGLWRQEVDASRPTRLLDGGPYHDVGWFPDGAVFAAGPHGGRDAAWRVPADGAEPEALIDGTGKVMVLSPDGREVATTDASGLWVAPLDGGPRRRLRPMSAADSTAGLVWSPDGAAIAAVHESATSGAAWLEITAADGSWTRRVHEGRALISLGMAPIAWTAPDRLLIGLSRGLTDARTAILAVDGASRATSLEAAVEVHAFEGFYVTRLLPASGARRLAYSRIVGQLQTWLVPVDAPEARRRVDRDDWDQIPVGWLDAGTVLISNVGGDRDLVAVPLDGGPSTPLLDHPVALRPVQWVGGELVAAQITHDPVTHEKIAEVVRRAADGTTRPLLRLGGGEGPEEHYGLQCRASWCLLSTPAGAALDFAWVDPDTGAREPAWREPVTSRHLAWAASPEGDRFALARVEPGELSIRALTHDGPGEVLATIPLDLNIVHHVAWAPDGASLYVSGLLDPSDTPYRLLRVHLDGRVEVLWTSMSWYLHSPVPSPDGRALAVGAYTFDDDLWLLDGVGEG